MRIQDVMSHQVLSVTPETTAADAAKVMQSNNIGSLPVVSNGQVVGMLTDRDIAVRAVAAGMDVNTLQVGQLMSQPVVSGSPSMDVADASRLMAEKQVRRLPVVDQNQLVGFVSLGDIALTSSEQMSGDALKGISQK